MNKADRVLVVAVNLNSGGGLTILLNFYRWAPEDSIFLIGSEATLRALQKVRPGGPVILHCPGGRRSLSLYLRGVERIRRRLGVRNVLALGNIPAIVNGTQTVYMHWPYYAYGFRRVSAGSAYNFVRRLARYALIKGLSRWIDKMVVQTRAMQSQVYSTQRPVHFKLSYVYPGVDEQFFRRSVEGVTRSKSGGVQRVIYPSLYYSHKNFEVVAGLCRLIDESGDSIVITTTLPDSTFSRLGLSQFRCVENIGVVAHSDMGSVYLESDVVIMPTKLETFGLPYLEAMSFGVPLVCSDFEFAREVCGDYPVYFHADDPRDFFRAVKQSLVRAGDVRDSLRRSATKQLGLFESWSASVESVFRIVKSS